MLVPRVRTICKTTCIYAELVGPFSFLHTRVSQLQIVAPLVERKISNSRGQTYQQASDPENDELKKRKTLRICIWRASWSGQADLSTNWCAPERMNPDMEVVPLIFCTVIEMHTECNVSCDMLPSFIPFGDADVCSGWLFDTCLTFVRPLSNQGPWEFGSIFSPFPVICTCANHITPHVSGWCSINS